eukprot:CAMPEP_0169460214 /NCGR_PEP_ID=MMETSP1042-20121227/18358_1 /TAXON_ID=464988 /ORGANISM="Hemiselmis andersenii, Strain CCMP1180" /LENGTH=233 /DNA_ID=CAMNT_0009572671 /DNA_START=816 /DNA_END=1517 /DNA_ORIENTATION=+
MELEKAFLFYKNTKARNAAKMISSYVKRLRPELDNLIATDVSLAHGLGEAHIAETACSGIECSELHNNNDQQDDAPMGDAPDLCGSPRANEQIQSIQTPTAISAVDKLCSSTCCGRPIVIQPTMQVSMSPATTVQGRILCCPKFKDSELYTVFKPSTPAIFAMHTFYRSNTTGRVMRALQPKLQLPKHMAGSEFLVQIFVDPGRGSLRLFWVDVMRYNRSSEDGKDPKTRCTI